MKIHHELKASPKPLYAAIIGSLVGVGSVGVLATSVPASPTALPNALVLAAACNPCNPCAAKNPCNPCNPCAAKNPCNPCNPCAAKNPCNPCNPCAAKNPCNPCNPCAAANPCNPCSPCAGARVNPCKVMRPAGKSLKVSDAPSVLAEGKRLWNDTSLSTNGLACQSCHVNDMSLNATFAEPYPHRVAMPYERAGVDEVHVDEMVQFCMVVPMQAEPFAWDSKELMALSSYTLSLQTAFNPCAAQKNPRNPCAAKNPCNPCAAKNPCNPCAAKNSCNPCNPCAAQQ